MLELMGAKYQDLIPRLITKTWFLLLRANHLVIARLVNTVASVLLTYTQIIARDMPPSHVNLINKPTTQYQFLSTNSVSLLGDAGLNTRVSERGPAPVLGGLLHTRWPLVCSCEVK